MSVGHQPDISPRRTAATRALVWYYLGTAGFLALDLVLGWNIRISALENTPVLKFGWYAGLLGCGLIIRRHPECSALVALIESSANLALLLGGIMLTYYGAVDAALAGDFAGSPFTPESILNAGVSGFALIGGIYANPLLANRVTPREAGDAE